MSSCPGWNSYGHNTLIPRLVPSVSAKQADGVTATEFGFCTSSQETFDLLFSIYDQIIDDYMAPYGMTAFATLLDEVKDGLGQNAAHPFEKTSPFCQCEMCRNKDHGQMFIDMVVKTTQHLKEKGIKSVVVANDMLYHEHNIACAWSGYHNWSAVYHPLRNIQILGQMNHRDGDEGLYAYSNWDRRSVWTRWPSASVPRRSSSSRR